jgi:hypothetical protein
MGHCYQIIYNFHTYICERFQSESTPRKKKKKQKHYTFLFRNSVLIIENRKILIALENP